MKTLSDRILELYKKNGLTVEKLAEKMEMSAAGLHKALKNGDFKLSQLYKMAEAFNCSIEDLLSDNYKSLLSSDVQSILYDYKLLDINTYLNQQFYKVCESDEVIRFCEEIFKSFNIPLSKETAYIHFTSQNMSPEVDKYVKAPKYMTVILDKTKLNYELKIQVFNHINQSFFKVISEDSFLRELVEKKYFEHSYLLSLAANVIVDWRNSIVTQYK